jgi:hypothetical protein
LQNSIQNPQVSKQDRSCEEENTAKKKRFRKVDTERRNTLLKIAAARAAVENRSDNRQRVANFFPKSISYSTGCI